MRRRKNNKIFIIILVAISVILFFKYENSKIKSEQEMLPTPINIDGTEIKTKSIHDTTIKYMDITATYPTTGIGADKVESKIRSIIQTFKDDNLISDTQQEDIPTLNRDEDMQYILNINYSTTHNNNLITHRLDIYNFTGGAHGGNIVETYTFNNNGEQVNISDLFINPNIGIKNLSNKVITKIKSDPSYKEAIESEWFKDGTDPTVDNYATFMIEDTDIKIIFQQYQIAPYVYGNIEVTISLTELADNIKPEYK